MIPSIRKKSVFTLPLTTVFPFSGKVPVLPLNERLQIIEDIARFCLTSSDSAEVYLTDEPALENEYKNYTIKAQEVRKLLLEIRCTTGVGFFRPVSAPAGYREKGILAKDFVELEVTQMHWHFRKLKYDILIPPLEKSIFALTEQETAEYFAWFMEKVPERVAYISGVCAKELHIPVEKMDCSPESLLLLWKWFRRKAKTERVHRTHKEKQDQRFPNVIFQNKRQLTLETEYILRDVGMYLGETFRKNNPAIYWTYDTKPRRYFFVNHPLLKGFVDYSTGKRFEASFEPIHMAGVQAAKVLKHNATDEDLLNLYKFWDKMREPGSID